MRNRNEAIEALKAAASQPQVLIVGGGINGIGLLRDLALQGVPSILVDKGDFASGTTAAPSRLIHGGLRYLETGEFALVRESVIERDHLIRNAPHLVKPLPVWVPAFDWFGGILSAGLRFLKLKKTPGPKGLLAVKLGLVFFDRFGRKSRTMPGHRIVAMEEVRLRIPSLSRRVRGVAEYYDARLVHPERLALELIKDAERDCPTCVAVPYMSLTGSDGRTVSLRDEITGETLSLQPRLVVNCTGAWLDEANARLGIDKRLIGGTRGSHLVMHRPDIARQLGDGMLYFETSDFRACLIYALDAELILAGTTDLRANDPDNAVCSDEEIDYIFDVIEQVLPGSAAKREQIVFAYAGIRPLPYSGEGATGAISRDHSLRMFEPEGNRRFPVLSLVGGKWTTYRACAEQIADAVLARLDVSRRASTVNEPIGGGAEFATEEGARKCLVNKITEHFKFDQALAEKMLRRYGSQATQVAEYVSAEQRCGKADGHSYHIGEIRWILADERVTRLADIVLRRTLLPFENGLDQSEIARIADIAGETLGWDEARRKQEIADTIALLATRHRVILSE